MVNYNFYRTEYCGDSIEAADFDRLSKRASEQLARYEKIYRVDGDEAGPAAWLSAPWPMLCITLRLQPMEGS